MTTWKKCILYFEVIMESPLAHIRCKFITCNRRNGKWAASSALKTWPRIIWQPDHLWLSFCRCIRETFGKKTKQQQKLNFSTFECPSLSGHTQIDTSTIPTCAHTTTYFWERMTPPTPGTTRARSHTCTSRAHNQFGCQSRLQWNVDELSAGTCSLCSWVQAVANPQHIPTTTS